MNIFKIWHGYRTFGFNEGLPVYNIEFGPALNLSVDEVLGKLAKLGVQSGGWVVLHEGALQAIGVSTLVKGLRYANVRVEVEEKGIGPTPPWFSFVDRWVIDWQPNGRFNYGALRQQDMLVCRSNVVDMCNRFLSETDGFITTKVIVTDNPNDVWDVVKNTNVRVL